MQFFMFMLPLLTLLSLTPRGISEFINILVVINTEPLLQAYTNGSTDLDHPKAITHEYAFMVAPPENVLSGQGTADLHITPSIGDMVRFYSTSETNNFETQVFVYRLVSDSEDIMGKPVVTPITNAPCIKILHGDIKNAVQHECTNFYTSSNIKGKGTLNYRIYFALFVANTDTHKMDLNGYYEWYIKITV